MDANARIVALQAVSDTELLARVEFDSDDLAPESKIMRFDGTRFQELPKAAPTFWASSPSAVWWFSDQAEYRTDTESKSMPLPGIKAGAGAQIANAWGSATDDVWVTTKDGRILRFDGVAWSTSLDTNQPAHTFKLAGTGPDNVWAFGRYTGPPDTAPDNLGSELHHFDGQNWQQVLTTERPIRDVWFAAPGDPLLLVGNQLHQVSNDQLHALGDPIDHSEGGAYRLWGASASELYALGHAPPDPDHPYDLAGRVWRRTSDGWLALELDVPGNLMGASQGWLYGAAGTLLRYDEASARADHEE